MALPISVIIPALNEASVIRKTLESLDRQDEPFEVIVVDGGSTDGTRSIADKYAQVISAPSGRARQMNEGARAACGDALLFLHADTLLPKDAFTKIRSALEDPATEGGAFRLRFDDSSPLLRFYSVCTRLPLPRLCFGDRAIFVRHRTFEHLGGYPDVPIFEDLELVRTLHKRSGFTFLEADVTTSARRFHQHGVLRQQLRNVRLWLKYIAGSDLRRLADEYPYTP